VRADYGSVRGASSFGLTYPKVYIDGIPVANPLLVSRITPEAVERIEVIRGPQGAALYGADAISGVTNIVTRHETRDAGAPAARLHGRVGFSSSAYGADPSLGQGYLLAGRVGSNTGSLGITADAGAVGAYVPEAYARHVAATAGARRVGATSIVTATARFAGEWVDAGINPLLPIVAGTTGRLARARRADSAESLLAYTLGLSARFQPGDRWRHALVAGVDGYALDAATDDAPIPLDDATAPRSGTAIRASARASTELHLDLGPRASAVATVALEQSVLHQTVTDDTTGSRPLRDALQPVPASAYDWRGGTGVVGQVTTAVWDRVFLSGGLRVERDAGTDAGARYATLPSVGGAWVIGGGRAAVKVRAAYGKGIRWPETLVRQTLAHRGAAAAAANALDPEEQAGVEAGVDLLVGHAVTLQLTRFDQTASGLIQRVTIAGDTTDAPRARDRRIVYAWQNVGEIHNDGWEIQGTVRAAGLAVTGAFTHVDSRVRAIADGYLGDLQVGDRMLGVPARTMGLTAGWTASRWSVSGTVYRAEDWVHYDRLALAEAFAGTTRPTRELVGDRLRAFWITSRGITQLRLTASVWLAPGLSLGLRADNLLDHQTGAPDNVTVLPGRTLTASLRTRL
jgi:iron complex outermembrane receptor protein